MGRLIQPISIRLAIIFPVKCFKNPGENNLL